MFGANEFIDYLSEKISKKLPSRLVANGFNAVSRQVLIMSIHYC